MSTMFKSIMEINSAMTMKVLVGPRAKETIIDAIPVGIDRGHHCPGALVYKVTGTDNLVMYDERRNSFFYLHGAQYDDIETPDGRAFAFADDGDYGVCSFSIPEGIRRRNTFIKELGVIQWEESLHYEWFEEDRRLPYVYQWDPLTDKARKVYPNGTFSGWHEYVIKENYRVDFRIDNPFDDDKYVGLIEWALDQPDEQPDDYQDVARRYERWERAGEITARDYELLSNEERAHSEYVCQIYDYREFLRKAKSLSERPWLKEISEIIDFKVEYTLEHLGINWKCTLDHGLVCIEDENHNKLCEYYSYEQRRGHVKERVKKRVYDPYGYSIIKAWSIIRIFSMFFIEKIMVDMEDAVYAYDNH